MPVEIICDNCGKKQTRIPSNVSNRNFCSRDCMYEHKKGRSNEARRRGKNISCDVCGKEVYKSNSELEGHDNHFCSSECHNEFQSEKVELECETCGESFSVSPSWVESKNRKFCSIECRNNNDKHMKSVSLKGNKTLQNKKDLTSLERKGRSLLDKWFGFEYKEQVEIGDKFIVDVLIPKHDLIIEWDGDYWHGHENQKPLNERQKSQTKKDKSKNAYLEECGYTVLRFWETDVYEKPEQVKEEIKQCI